MASLLFRDAIDYTRVRIHGRRYIPFQPKNCAMTPNGSLHTTRLLLLGCHSLLRRLRGLHTNAVRMPAPKEG
jgi:hypothetical protein